MRILFDPWWGRRFSRGRRRAPRTGSMFHRARWLGFAPTISATQEGERSWAIGGVQAPARGTAGTSPRPGAVFEGGLPDGRQGTRASFPGAVQGRAPGRVEEVGVGRAYPVPGRLSRQTNRV